MGVDPDTVSSWDAAVFCKRKEDWNKIYAGLSVACITTTEDDTLSSPDRIVKDTVNRVNKNLRSVCDCKNFISNEDLLDFFLKHIDDVNRVTNVKVTKRNCNAILRVLNIEFKKTNYGKLGLRGVRLVV